MAGNRLTSPSRDDSSHGTTARIPTGVPAHWQWLQTFDCLTNAVALVDREGTIVKASHNLGSLLGTPTPDLLGKSCHHLTDRLALGSPCPHCESARTRGPVSVELRLPSNRSLALSAAPLLAPEGAPAAPPVQTLLLFRDITESRPPDAGFAHPTGLLAVLARALTATLDPDPGRQAGECLLSPILGFQCGLPPPAGRIQILIAGDHPVVRVGLRRILTCQPDLEVVAEASDLEGAVCAIDRTVLDIAILVLAMAHPNGVETLKRIVQCSPRTRALVLTVRDDPTHLRAVLAAGGSGYLVTRASPAEILLAIRTVHRGEKFVDPILAGSVLEGLVRNGSALAPGPIDLLSPRERQVLDLLGQGYQRRQVAEQLGLGVPTVATYRARLRRKLGLPTGADLELYAHASALRAFAPPV